MNPDRLIKLGSSPFFVTAMDKSEFANLARKLVRQFPGAVVRTIRGKKCRSLDDFFDEIAAAWQFPYYFGENWNAFDEVISDLEWLEGDAYLFMVADAELLLVDDSVEDFKTLLRILTGAYEAWLTPNVAYMRTDQPTPFHVLFQCHTAAIDTFTYRLATNGATYEVL